MGIGHDTHRLGQGEDHERETDASRATALGHLRDQQFEAVGREARIRNEVASRTETIARIEPDPNQPRKKIDPTHLQELTASVRKLGILQPITVRFTILADGSLGDVQVVESSGATLLDMAAKRAVYSAQPFGPLPKSYGTTSYTIQAIFKPSS